MSRVGLRDENITVYFDMDGVLANFRGYCDERNIKYNPDGVFDEAVDTKMWAELNKDDHFYYNLPPIEGSVELFKDLNKDYNCEILTAVPRPKWNIVNAVKDKIDWCKDYLGENVKVNICYRREKQQYAEGRNTILVDDLGKNIDEWERQGGYGILFKDAKSFDRTLIDTIAKRQGIENNKNIYDKKGKVTEYAYD